MMFAPLRNIAIAFPAADMTVHTPKPANSAKDGLIRGPIHHRIKVAPKLTSTNEIKLENVRTATSERVKVFLTQLVSPRASASPYAGQSGLKAMPITNGTAPKSFAGTE